MRALLLTLLVLAAPSLVPSALAQPALSDRLDAVRQATAVELVLSTDEAMEGLEAEVDVRGGVVTLTGEAETVQQRERAGRLASGVPGVREVMNRLRVGGQEMQAALVRPGDNAPAPPRRATPPPPVTFTPPPEPAATEAEEPDTDRDPVPEPDRDPAPEPADEPTPDQEPVPEPSEPASADPDPMPESGRTAEPAEGLADWNAPAAEEPLAEAAASTDEPAEVPPSMATDEAPGPEPGAATERAPRVGADVDVVAELRAETAAVRAELERMTADYARVVEENDRLRAELAARPTTPPAAEARPAPAPRRARPAPAPPTHHRVTSGENLIGIARRYGTTVAELRRLNNLTDANSIRIGQRLRLR